eukprot:TRINITY_DN5854_c0_g1_i2.p2 TRINITY_DN5854_c0_g1~~TRINITY_DN5854_c0_g1_i2.p2  ORF type:complete len:127 (+),score=0.57 TRINITY_DN5854_c0_g1_i2:142-522(+)
MAWHTPVRKVDADENASTSKFDSLAITLVLPRPPIQGIISPCIQVGTNSPERHRPEQSTAQCRGPRTRPPTTTMLCLQRTSPQTQFTFYFFLLSLGFIIVFQSVVGSPTCLPWQANHSHPWRLHLN